MVYIHKRTIELNTNSTHKTISFNPTHKTGDSSEASMSSDESNALVFVNCAPFLSPVDAPIITMMTMFESPLSFRVVCLADDAIVVCLHLSISLSLTLSLSRYKNVLLAGWTGSA